MQYKYEEEDGTHIVKTCPDLLKSPFVCNPCGKNRHCSYQKQFYYAKAAQKEYKALLVESREGIRETDLFFCDPYRSSQKPKVEKNHTLFMRVYRLSKSARCLHIGVAFSPFPVL